VEARARGLYAKQACHRLASGGRPQQHLSYWVGLRLLRFLPELRVGPHAENPPPHFAHLAELFLRVFGLEGVRPDNLKAVTAAGLYKAWRPEPPVPKIQLKLPGLPWRRIWGRLALPSLPQSLHEVGYGLLNNILPTGERRHRLRLVASPACDFCQRPLDNVLHAFTACVKVTEAWESLLVVASRLLGGAIPDEDLLYLKFRMVGFEIHIVYAVLAYADLVWENRGRQGAISPLEVRARLAQPPAPFKSIFKL